MRKVLGVSLDAQLWGRVDAARGDVPRSVFVRRALEAALGPHRIEVNEKGEHVAVTAYSIDASVLEESADPVPRSRPVLPAGVKTGAQIAREQNAARMAKLNEGKYGR